MATASLQVNISTNQEAAILKYASSAHTLLTNQFAIRDYLEIADRNYMREADFTQEEIRAKVANRLGDKKKLQNVTIPIIMPQIESALEYMMNVFVTGYPIFGVSADPATENAALMMETIMAENATTAGWARELMMFFRDGLKYNLHALEVTWKQKKVYTVKTDVAKENSASPTEVLWNGNVFKRMDLYNTFFDPRVHPAEIHSEGEYAGYIEIFSRIRMKKFINDQFGKISKNTVLRALQSMPNGDGTASSGAPYQFYRPLINPFPTMNNNNNSGMDWLAWAQETGTPSGIRYSNVYEVMTLYARIIPKDFNLDVPQENTPQVWKFIIINGSVVLFAERQTNAHNFIPIFFGQPIEDGLDYQTKSFAANVQDMQDVASAMWNGYIAGQRRLVGDRALFDPSRVRAADINSLNPAAKIPVRPSAYGKPVSEAVYQFPYRGEPTESLVQGATMVTNMANLINGQNPAQQGQFVKGNKTKHEYDDIMGHGNGRNQCMAMFTENQVFVPVKECLKLNILQYQGDDVLYNADKQSTVQIKTTDLRAVAVHFKVSDGLIPEDKIMSDDVFQTALQALNSNPAIGSAYNLAPLMTYIFKMQGADLSPFEKSPAQIQYEQQMQAWNQAAQQALIKGVAFNTPMPQPSQQYQQEMQQAAQTGGVKVSGTDAALEGTVGANTQFNVRSQIPYPTGGTA